MDRVVFRPLQPGDISHVATHLREADRQELIAAKGAGVSFGDALARAVLLSSHTWVAAGYKDTPIAIFGVAPVSMLEGLGSPWFLSTERAYEHPRNLVRSGRRYLAEMRKHYSRLFNYVDARNDKSIRWLRRLGFTVLPAVPYGREGEMFHRFEIGPE